MIRLPMILALAAIFASTSARADFSACLNSLRGSVLASGVSAKTFDQETRDLQADMEVVGFLDAQPEFRTPIWDYLAGLVDEERVEEGKEQLRDHDAAFRATESKYGVDRATVAAVWGVESNYGKGFGKRRVVQSLATLSCYGRRQAYFRTELIAALQIIDNGDVDPDQFYGSWAGAFGHTQFMPSTFLRAAVSMDGTGHRDVVNSIPNALGSTGNYLSMSGWQTGVPWGFEVKLPDNYNGPSGRTNRHPMSYWEKLGIRTMDDGALGEGSAGLLLPAGANGPAFLVTRNFDAIYAYNAAESYALAIALLSDRLRGEAGVQTPWPEGRQGLSRAERRELQDQMRQRGYDMGAGDAILGTKSRQAIADYRQRTGLSASGGADHELLDTLRSGK